MANPTEDHWQVAKRVLRYLAGTRALGIVYTKGAGGAEAFGDSDFAADMNTRKSRSGTVILKNGGAILWSSKLQATVATSTCEAECSSGAAVVRQALWFRLLLSELNGVVEPMPVYCDNQSALTLMREHAVGIGGRKHIDIAYMFVREHIMRGDVIMSYVRTDEQFADIFTKALPAPKFEELRSAVGVREF
jgi:hypothetical protein